MNLKLSGLALAVFGLCAAPALADDKQQAFYEMCEGVSINDGLSPDVAGQFCTCLTEKVSADDALYTELFEAGTNEPDLDTRLASLSEGALEAAGSCQASE
ncbi:MAG: hypothetical protein MRY64_12780 [Hyphomonadaceae bacterium]|nr:hypothetical protein [Hyphomonadaceae bacterium]